jgi:predicted permease
MVDTGLKDLQFAARTLRKRPGFTIVAVLALGLGIGANTAIFTIIDALFLKPLPVQQPDRLVIVGARDASPTRTNYTFYHPEFVKFRDRSTVFSDMAAVGTINRSNLMINGPGGGAEPGQVQVGLVSGNYFSLLGVNAAIGRTFTADDDRVPDGHPVAVISYDYWSRRFALASDIVGRTLTLNATTFAVLGVTPRGFSGDWVGNPNDLWVPLMMQREVMPEVPSLAGFPTRAIARLKSGMTMNQAEAASQVLYQQLQHEAMPKPTPEQQQQIARQRIVLESLERGYSPQRETFTQPLSILMAGVGLLLLIVCANVANLLLARSTTRRKEVSVRRALGASRGRIVRQMLTESLLLAGLGGILGVLVALWLTKVLAAMAGSPAVFPFVQGPVLSLDLHLGSRIVLFIAVLSFLTAILFGLAPAFRGSQVSLSADLNDRSLGGVGKRHQFGLGRMLIAGQVAFSLLLLAIGGLLVRTLFNLEKQDLGFDREHLLLVWAMPGQTGRSGPALTTFWHTVQDRLSSIPGVTSASALNGGVLNGIIQAPGSPTNQMTVVGQPPKPTTMPGGRTFVTPRLFETMGIPLIAGREFAETDTASAPPVVIINETMARFYFGDSNPVGQRVMLPWQRPADPPTTIVGVVKDHIKGTPRGVSQPQFSTFLSYRDGEAAPRLWTMCIVVKTNGSPIAAADLVRQELRSLDPNLPILKIDTIEQQLSDVLAQDRMIAMLSGCFGLSAVVLACLGLYGVISYSVACRRSEIGVHLAFGASPSNVSRLVLWESMLPVVAGIVVGIPVILVTARLIASRLFGISSTDLPTVGIATFIVVTVAGCAALLPARAASKVDPMLALRYD